MQKVTINVVADYAGVSKKTVSRVLNDEPNVSDKTKEKVRAAFAALAYKPSPQARGLASNQSFLIGLIYNNPSKSYISDIQTGALSICNKEGYHLLIHPTDHESEDLVNNLRNVLTQSQLDGLVLTPPLSDVEELLDMLEEIAIPYVRIAPTRKHSISPCVINNDEQAAFDMTQYLISLGHSLIGFIKGHPTHNVSKQRFLGYKRGLESNGICYDERYVEEGLFDFFSGERCARKLLALETRPTAIFASNDYMAAGVLKVASQKNIAVPHELSITGFDNAPLSRYIWPSLTTVQQPIEEMACTALKLLIRTIRKEALENRMIQLENRLIIRESSAPVQPGISIG